MYKSKEADKFMLKYADKFVNLLKEVNDKVCGKKMTQIYQKIPEWKEDHPININIFLVFLLDINS